MNKNKIDDLLNFLDLLYPDAQCELNYTKDYELLIATVLSAQCTDKRVNMVTKELWEKYDVFKLAKASKKEIEGIIRPVGNYTKKASYIISICQSLVENYKGVVPNNREYLESLNGVGRKTCNVVLANLYNVPAIAVDTHVNRVSKRLKLAFQNDDVLKVEQKLMKKIPQDRWNKFHHQMVLFGRYFCKAIKPNCQECKLIEYCSYKNKNLKDSK